MVLPYAAAERLFLQALALALAPPPAGALRAISETDNLPVVELAKKQFFLWVTRHWTAP
jgi:hypothetical protein